MLLAAAICAPLQARAAASAEEIRSAVEKVYGAGDYQRELPLPDGADGRGIRNWRRDDGDARASDRYRPALRQNRPGSGFDFQLPAGVVDVLELLMWVVLFAGGALILYFLVNETGLYFRRKRGEGRVEEEVEGPAREQRPGDALLADYDRLAAEGDYAGAVHALLLHCIARMRERGDSLSSSMTSREIVRRLPLEEQEREALTLLVRVTELTHFGGRGATEADFRQCRDQSRRIAAGGTA